MNLLQRYESTWHEEMKNNSQCESVTQSIQFVVLTVVCTSSMRHIFTLCSKFAVNQNASINKNSKTSNSRSLKQYTFAKSISLCFCLLEKSIDFSYKYSNVFCSRSRSRFSFSWSSHIFFVFAFLLFVFAFTSSRLSHLLWDFQLQQRSVTISTLQSMNLFVMSIDQKEWNSRFETKLEKDERIVLRACLRFERYFINESSYED